MSERIPSFSVTAAGATSAHGDRVSASANKRATTWQQSPSLRLRDRRNWLRSGPRTDLYSRIVIAHIFDNFYDYDHLARPFKFRLCTAAAMPEVSDDFRTWTVRLKPGIYFEDDPRSKASSRELVAADYVYSYKRFFDPQWKSAPLVASPPPDLKILGMAALAKARIQDKQAFRLRHAVVEGLRALDRYTIPFRVRQSPVRVLNQALADLRACTARSRVKSLSVPVTP